MVLFSVVEFCKLIALKPIFPLLIATVAYVLFNLNNTVKTNEILLLIAALLVSIRSLLFLFEKKDRFLDTQAKYVFLIGYLIIPIIIFTKGGGLWLEDMAATGADAGAAAAAAAVAPAFR